jgi:hypothetical protein
VSKEENMKHWMMNKLTWVSFSVCFTLSCDNDDIKVEEQKDENQSYIIFGHFYGFCQGEQCVENFKLTESKLFEETTDPYVLKPGEGIFLELDHIKFEQVKSLASMIPPQLLHTTDVFIGSPDAADGGGIYFETAVNGERKFWRIDKVKSNLPEYLVPFVNEIEKDIAVIED